MKVAIVFAVDRTSSGQSWTRLEEELYQPGQSEPTVFLPLPHPDDVCWNLSNDEPIQWINRTTSSRRQARLHDDRHVVPLQLSERQFCE
jgi:hypothetical protein